MDHTGGDGTVSISDVLGVVREFEPFEPAGVGTGLVAWELQQDDAAITPLIGQAIERGLLEYAGVDERTGQRLWRLTDEGRRGLGAGQ
jgi:hypothetical protein